MSNTVIKVENLSKQYRLGQVGTGTLSHDLNRWWAKVRGKEDPFLKIGEVNDRATKGGSEFVWALKDIGFEVKQGEVLGIIGKNGAGKSTLLKILSKVTGPTTGSVKAKGRIASLLEVGTGFHPELTGRENIYLNGTILGMTKKDVDRKLEEIVDFAGVARYLDTPVKRYSSGMTVRLGFAVAAYLEPEILIVDEVLAVGDAEFQKKAVGKMQEVSRERGRTVLFVSHNMASVKSLCSRAVVLEDGKIGLDSSPDHAVSYYIGGNAKIINKRIFGEYYNKDRFILHEISINPKGGSVDSILDEFQEIELNTTITIKNKSERLHLTFVLNNESGEPLFAFTHAGFNKIKNGKNYLKCIFPKGFLNIGTFYLTLYIIEDSKRAIFVDKDIISFRIQEGERGFGAWMGKEPGFIKPTFKWEVDNQKQEL